MRKFCSLILAASLLTGWVVSAQDGMTLSGTVEDQAGGVIPEAKLTLISEATREIRVAVADEGGGFSFPNLPPGKYSLKAEAKDFEMAEVQVAVGDKPLEPIKLKLGINLKSEDVTITDTKAEKVISAENNSDAIDLGSDFLKALPAQSEDILPILSNFLSTSAQGTEGLSVVVDGIEGTQINVPTDSIKRVLINRNPYSPAYRRPGAGRVEVLTKDGSRRRYDGTFAYYVRNAFFDARDTFTRRFAKPNPNLDRRLFSGSFGGPAPLLKGATFFFSVNNLVNYEDAVSTAVLTSSSGLVTQHVPTTTKRTNLMGRFDLRPNEVHTLAARYYHYRVNDKNKGLGAPFVLPEQAYDTSERGNRLMFSDRAILSPTLLNDLTFSFDRKDSRQGERTDKPMLIVRAAFIGGPSQVARSSKETTLEVQDAVTYTRGNHTIRFGGGFRPRFVNAVNASNFGGTYTFQDFSDYENSTPIQFLGMQGETASSFRQYEANGFFEDEIKLRRWLSITPGFRYDWQSSLKDHNNFGPRLSFAMAPGSQKTVLRGGAGIFYERLPESAHDQFLIDGVHTRELKISNPSYPDPFRAGSRRRILPTIWVIDPDLSAPYVIIGSLSLERRLWNRSQISVEYQRLHGVHLFRAHNINAPLDDFGPQFIGLRPNPDFLGINQIESSASSRSSSLKATFQGRIGKWFKGMAQYTYSSATDDTDGIFMLPENNYDIGRELGRSNFDQRHRFSYVSTFELPRFFRLGAVLSLASGIPFDVTTGFDDNGDREFNDRPPGGTRNTSQGPSFAQLDLRLTKLFRFPSPFGRRAGTSERKLKNFEFSIDAFNVLNHPNTPVITGELQSHVFGQASTAKIARTLQLSVKYSF